MDEYSPRLNPAAVNKTSNFLGGRVSRAGRILRPVGAWWKVPARIRQSRELMPSQKAISRTESSEWKPAFNKTLNGSGQPNRRLSTKRRAGSIAKRITFGAGFMKSSTIHGPLEACENAAAHQQMPQTSWQDISTSFATVSLIELDDTPTRRVLDVSLSSDVRKG
jgi:hypothetical protein